MFRYFATIMDRNRDSNHQSQNEDDFRPFSWARVLKWGRKEKNNGKGDSASALSRFASLFEGEMQQIVTDRHSGKTKQMTNWSVSTFKGKLKCFRFEIFKFKTRAFNRKLKWNQFPLRLIRLLRTITSWYCRPFFASDLVHNSTDYVIEQLVHAFSCALSSYGALGKFGEHSTS